MRQNPYLAHYFSASPDTSAEDAVAEFGGHNGPTFVHSRHMQQRVFRPSSRGGALTAACTPPSTPSGGRPPLSPGGSRHSTPVETNGKQHSHVAMFVNGIQDGLRNVSPRQGKVESVTNWDSMIRHSHEVIAQAKELLNIENASEVDDVGRSSTQAVHTASQTSLKKEEEQQEQREQKIPDKVINDNLAHSKTMTKAEETSKEPSSVVLQEEKEVKVDKGGVLLNSKTVGMQSNLPVSNNYDENATKIPLVSATPEAKCLVVTLNQNSAECVAKRLTRRPSYAFAFQKNRNSIVSDLNDHPKIPYLVAEEKPVSKPHSKEKNPRSSSKEKKKKKEGVISVASLYGILERLADVVHPRYVDPVGSNSKNISLDISHERRRSFNNSVEDRRALDETRKRDHARHSVPTPQVLMGSAPRINVNETVVGNDIDVSNGMVPTSQLAMCGVNPHRVFPQRAPSARRSSFNRTSKTPGYALPTESWLCKGSELSDVHEDTSSIPNGLIPKGPLH
ncbi:putative UDP-Gal or UDP-GlcNAc-dependent glycosyltransferase [Trypanosoma theileri]|uniref:Putative UDP-Gal or UDP-GlcNAc-dependent glycosyltransferase n=1 Tax=Trypanosoma theileri TaxID=67003 RepID=A0A1X0P4Z9_9TRYP|nr:putative UDP-Gal or UDP-GlcNAc-dependent glycosyltransferase [Trypanosoma theileri]ORC91945.1 putative UDP-Gal or UDP-GlcNAc-dependent glycosyltransferase [Trypanosoma theileri]